MNAEQRRRVEDTLRVVDALVKAADRREEVFHVVEDSERRRLIAAHAEELRSSLSAGGEPQL